MSRKDRIINLKPGDKVKRNPDHWIWGDQDGNGHGTVIKNIKENTHPVIVKWNKNSFTNSYRYQDLKYSDASTTDDLLDMLDELEEKLINT